MLSEEVSMSLKVLALLALADCRLGPRVRPLCSRKESPVQQQLGEVTLRWSQPPRNQRPGMRAAANRPANAHQARAKVAAARRDGTPGDP